MWNNLQAKKKTHNTTETSHKDKLDYKAPTFQSRVLQNNAKKCTTYNLMIIVPRLV